MTRRKFKLGVIQELDTASLTEVCRRHSLHASTVIGWRKERSLALARPLMSSAARTTTG
ncbi:hypothetical protein HY641_01260 [Candidatus Woesearchaeota archaeon]|nr:hypothetical protein [Candidatus Woesearchaeota archaeon]